MPILPLLVTMMWTYITIACGMRCLTYFVMPLVWRNTMTSPETLTIPDLLTAWDRGKLTALDITITSPELCHHAELSLTLSCDVSPYGLGAVLSHIMPDGVERPVAYASWTLTTVERSYAQIDKEELVVAWGVKYFHNTSCGGGSKWILRDYSRGKASSVIVDAYSEWSEKWTEVAKWCDFRNQRSCVGLGGLSDGGKVKRHYGQIRARVAPIVTEEAQTTVTPDNSTWSDLLPVVRPDLQPAAVTETQSPALLVLVEGPERRRSGQTRRPPVRFNEGEN
ncbi:hypothetical protein EMCRGX_G011163 [Ephydatia muelleri]